MGMNREELKDRVEAKKKKLQSDLAEAKANARGKTNETVRSLENKLEELEDYIEESWEDLSENVAKRLNDWLK